MGRRTKRKATSLLTVIILILATFTVIDLVFDIVPRAEAKTIYVPTNYPTIQEAVNAAEPGDTVYVYSGTYYENVVVGKTINLVGEDRDTTIINASFGGGDAVLITTNWVNITGFTVTGAPWEFWEAGIEVENARNCRVINNNASNNGVGILAWNSGSAIGGNIISDNIVSFNGDLGVHVSSNGNTISSNTIYNSVYGIYLSDKGNNNVVDNTIFSNGLGIVLESSNSNNITDNIVSNEGHGVSFTFFSVDNVVTNCSISNSSHEDFYLFENSHATIINTTFDKTKIEIHASSLTVKWYLHVKVTDYLSNPVPNAKVRIEDNKKGPYNETFTTDGNGYLRWIPVTEYIDKGYEKAYYTPNRITAWNDTLVGYAEALMDESKTISIVIYHGTLLDLGNGWNLISLPRIQSNTNLETILQSIENRYDSIWLHNVTDVYDPWKHYHASKPSNLNDLWELNHMGGFWVQVTDPEGTTLAVFGDELSANQSISLYPGWNLVGYPSTMNRTRDEALNNLEFDTDIYKVQTYNATTQKWITLGPSDYFEVGKGHWIYSFVKKDWDVPL